MTAKADVVVLGATTAQELFGFRDPIGQTVDINGQPMAVIGVLNSVGSSTSSSTTSNPDDQAVVPLTTASSLLFSGASRNSVSQILIQATSAVHTVRRLPGGGQRNCSTCTGSPAAADADFTITSEAQRCSPRPPRWTRR